MQQKNFVLITAVLLFSLIILSGCESKNSNSNNAVISEDKPIGDHRDESLNGRGISEGGRREPQYVNVIGYAAVSHRQAFNIENAKNFQDKKLWVVPTYKRDKQFWEETGTIPHKTEVVVREQILNHKGFSVYNGHLLVEKTDDKSQYYIDVGNFITKPYWTYKDSIVKAASTGIFIAKYNQVSDYYPVTGDGEKLSIPNETVILVTGLAGTSSKYDSNKTDIEATVWKKWRYGYGGVKCYFNSKDISITY